MNNKAYIPFRLPGLNEYTKACNNHYHNGGKLKKKTEADIYPFIAGIKKFKGPVKIMFIWHEKTRNRDIDNIAFAKKFILDTLVTAGVLIDDSQKYVKGFSDGFSFGEKDGVEIVIYEDE